MPKIPRHRLTWNDQQRLNAEVNANAADLNERLAEPERREELVAEGGLAVTNFALRRAAMLEEPLSPADEPELWKMSRRWDGSVQVAHFRRGRPSRPARRRSG